MPPMDGEPIAPPSPAPEEAPAPAAPTAAPHGPAALDLLNDPLELLASRLSSEPNIRLVLGILEPVIRSPDFIALLKGLAQNELRAVQLYFDSATKLSPIARAAVLRRLTPEARAELAVQGHTILEQAVIDQTGLNDHAQKVGLALSHALIALTGLF